jgi:hypothetical protein
MTIEINDTLANARADQITTARDAGAGGGLIRIYDGVRPAKGGTATTLLAELTFSDPSSPAASSGVLTASTITGANAVATGTATWYREVDSNGLFVLDGDVGTSGSDLNLNTTSIVVGNPVNITSYVVTEGNL